VSEAGDAPVAATVPSSGDPKQFLPFTPDSRYLAQLKREPLTLARPISDIPPLRIALLSTLEAGSFAVAEWVRVKLPPRSVALMTEYYPSLTYPTWPHDYTDPNSPPCPPLFAASFMEACTEFEEHGDAYWRSVISCRMSMLWEDPVEPIRLYSGTWESALDVDLGTCGHFDLVPWKSYVAESGRWAAFHPMVPPMDFTFRLKCTSTRAVSFLNLSFFGLFQVFF
jgi:hypothetical protein